MLSDRGSFIISKKEKEKLRAGRGCQTGMVESAKAREKWKEN